MALEIISMDLSSTLILGSALSAVVVVLCYIIYKVGIGEKSFEEVLAEQKKRSIEEELKLKQKSEKVKKEKKFKKTWGKKTKEKTEPEVVPESVQVSEPKETIPVIEIIEPKETKPAKQKNKSKPTSNQQAIDTPVPDKAKKVENLPTAEKPVQDKKKSIEAEKVKAEPKAERVKAEPKAEKVKAEPKNEKVKAEPKVEKVKVDSKVEVPKPAEVKESVPSPPVVATQVAAQPSASLHKKKKKEHVEKDVPMTASKLLSIIKESALESEEIQNFIDVLLNKQKDSSGWTTKNDSLAATKKNLHDKEQLSDQEARQNQVTATKLKEENNALKSKLIALDKSSQEKVTRMHQEIQNLTARLKQLQDQLVAEKEKAIQVAKENEKIVVTAKGFEEEKSKLLQKISKLETESRSGISKSDYDSVKKSREDLQKVHTILVEQHTQLVLKEKSQTVQLLDVKKQLEKLNSTNKTSSVDHQALKDSIASLELAKKSAEEKLKAEEKRSAELETRLKQLSAQVTDMTPLIAQVKDLKSENERLVNQLVTTKERVAGDGQEVLHQNGELNGKSEAANEKLLDEKDNELKEKESLIVKLNEEVSKQKANIKSLYDEIDVQKKKSELEKKDSLLEFTERVKKAENDLAQRLSDYNKELEKNRQLSSKMAECQSSLDDTKALILKNQTETRECLQRLHPEVSIDSSLPFEKWLLEFKKQALVAIESASTQSTSSNIEELLQQKDQEYRVKQKHYEQVLAETEAVLVQLQKTAESQEKVWQERLSAKQEELEKVKLERDNLVAEKEAMQSTFQQISQLEELQEKLKLLQSTLENAESERSHLEQKYDEVNKNCLNLRDQLENKEKEILELQKDTNNVDSLNKEIEDLKSKLEKEKKISKDFSSQMIRLNSLVKIGQDALTAEQEMVKKLKSQLEAAQVSTANGTASTTKSSPVTVNEDASDKK